MDAQAPAAAAAEVDEVPVGEPFFGMTAKRKPLLVFNGFAYTVDKNGKGDTVYWRCEKRKDCKARCKTVAGQVMKIVNEHTHFPDASRPVVQRAKEEIRQRASSTVEPTQAILQSVTNRLTVDEASSLPRPSSMKKAIQRERLRAGNVPPNPRSLQELVIPEQFQQTTTGEQFLLFDSGPGEARILIFSTFNNLEMLSKCNSWFADGTFKTVPKLFTQLYTIHAKCNGQVFPLVYGLLPNTQRATYDRFLTALSNMRDDFTPVHLLTDFEKPAIQSFQYHFPGVDVSGCLFHLSQNIYKHVQQYGLQVEYSQNEEFALVVRMMSALAFCPPADVVDSWILLQEEFPGVAPEREQRLIEYFDHYYVGDLDEDGIRTIPMFPIPLWNVHERVLRNEPRSNNSAEAWHRRFNLAVMCHHPTVWKFFEALQSEQRACEHSRARLRDANSPPPRKRKYVDIDRRLITLVNTYEARERMSFLRGIAHNLKQY